jgi:hypothetical protein
VPLRFANETEVFEASLGELAQTTARKIAEENYAPLFNEEIFWLD